MKLLLFGGVPGVGKTTLLSFLEDIYTHQITWVDPGELFRRYVYNQNLKTATEVEEFILNSLIKMPRASVAVLHWHYAVWRSRGYIPQMNFSRLKRLAESGSIEKVYLCLIEAPISTIYERRLRDNETKRRSLSCSTIEKEIAAEKKFLHKHMKLFSRVLGSKNVVTFHFTNTDLAAVKLLLSNFFASLMQ